MHFPPPKPSFSILFDHELFKGVSFLLLQLLIPAEFIDLQKNSPRSSGDKNHPCPPSSMDWEHSQCLSSTRIRARDQTAIPEGQKLEAFLKFVFNFIVLNLVSFQKLRELTKFIQCISARGIKAKQKKRKGNRQNQVEVFA